MAEEDENNQNQQRTAVIQRVGLKIPPFWEESPDIWFAQIEAQFQTTQVTTDQSKFNAVVGAIESKILTQVADAVLKPPATDRYKNLKEKILEAFSESEHKKMTKLLENIAIGDQKPSMLLNEMRRLSTADITEDLLKTLWLKRLPTQIRIMLSTNEAALPELAKIADKMVEIGNFGTVNQISAGSSQTDSLQNCIMQLTKAVESLQRNQNSNSNNNRSPSNNNRGRARSKSRGRNNTGSTPAQKQKKKYDTCWRHYRFGAKANRCDGTPEEPCNFSKN